MNCRELSMKKAIHATDRMAIGELQELVNVGPAIARDLKRIGISTPQMLIGKDPYELYRQLCICDGIRHDPCVIDCLISVVDFMNGNPPRQWWDYTAKRKLEWDGSTGLAS